MAYSIPKQNIPITFASGLEQKTDSKQIPFGKFSDLVNSNFNRQMLLQKRNGFGTFSTSPAATTLTTFNNNLLTMGNNRLNAFSQDNGVGYDRGLLQSVKLTTLPIMRSSTSQTSCDLAVSSKNLACVVFLDGASTYKYQIFDYSTGQVVVSQTSLPATATMARVYALGRYFIITFGATVAAAPHFQYIAIPITTPQTPGAAVDIATTISSITAANDGVVANNNLYLCWNGNDGGGAIRVTRLDANLNQLSTIHIDTFTADLLSITADITQSTANIWVTFWETTGNNGFTTVLNQNLVQITAPFQTITNKELIALTSVAQNMDGTLYYEVSNTYSYSPNHRSDYIEKTKYTSAGVLVTAATIILRSVGVASKAFIIDGNEYLLAAYGGAYQPTYFLIDSSGDAIAKVAYSNGGGYVTTQVLTNVTVVDSIASMAYLFKDLLAPVNKTLNATQVAGIYTQTGVNAVSFDLSTQQLNRLETGENLMVSGGILWAYDGVKPVEQNFHLYPEDVVVTTNTAGGSLADQIYNYAVTYEWTDSQGNLHRSAPSVPVAITTTGGGTSTNTVKIPTLRVTYKVSPNAVRIVIYRWSTANPIFYQITSITSPQANSTTTDSISYTDTVADASIIGNLILYTTGGVVENIGPPGTSIMTLFNNRFFLVDAENDNLMWYSKTIVQNTPVEMSNLFTKFISPTIGVVGSTGGMKVLGSMDDKIIIFKKNAIYYFVGNGPDITGAQNDFSEPIFITSTIGSDNPFSLALIPQGLIFQSDRGIWLLGRNLQTSYIGAPVQGFNALRVVSVVVPPGNNEVRFSLEDGTVLNYDYYYDQWGTFANVPNISSTIYNGLHTYLDSNNLIRQETPGVYLDGSTPVLLDFTTGWFNLAGLQGFQRAYFFYLLGAYLSPHQLFIEVGFDYQDGFLQSVTVTPDNATNLYGGDSYYGDTTPYGGPGNVEQFRIFMQKQKCQAFRIRVREVYDASLGVAPGAGFNMSGINLVAGVKKTYVPLQASKSAG